MNDAIEKAKKFVDDLYEFRDNYFVINELKYNGENNKEKDVHNKLQEVLSQLEKLRIECEANDRATFCMLKGRALNVTNKFDNNALELLSKCVKLNPQLIHGWNQLGECYWKNNDLKAAFNCFEGALKHDKTNKIALRSSSMVLRQIGDTVQEKHDNLIKSLDKAKEAVKSDVNDGISWYILGNAYLTLFFNSLNYDSSVLKACKTAYGNAKRDQIANSQSDFLFNYANILHYEENYEEALECLNKASLISPDWSEPNERKRAILNYLKDTTEMTQKRASLKQRRIQSLHNSLINDCKSLSSQTKKLITFKELSHGANTNVIINCKVIGCINSEIALAHTYCVMDTDKECIAIVIFNLSLNRGLKLGDNLLINDPFLTLFDIHYENYNYKFQSVRIDNPLLLMVNGKCLTKDHIARPRIDNSLRND